MTKFILFFILLISKTASSQEVIDVTDQTIRVGAKKEEELVFGFAAGDKILFSFFETDKKELKEVEILEYPGSSKFADYKTNSVEKSLNVMKQGIYIFRFKNSSLSGRVCRISIKRIPGSEATRNYNSAITWIEKQDTSWNSFVKNVVTGYDTTYVQKTRKELVKVDTVFFATVR